MCKVNRNTHTYTHTHIHTHIKMIGAFRLLYTIIRDRIFLNRTWEETKKGIEGCVKEDSVFKIVEPVVWNVMSDERVVRQEFKV